MNLIMYSNHKPQSKSLPLGNFEKENTDSAQHGLRTPNEGIN